MEQIYLVLDAEQSKKLPMLVAPSHHKKANAFFTVAIDESGRRSPLLGVVLKPGVTISPGTVVICAFGEGMSTDLEPFAPPAC